jgi:hypothetical protein
MNIIFRILEIFLSSDQNMEVSDLTLISHIRYACRLVSIFR